MMKLTGFCIVLFAVSGLINDYSKRKKADIAMLYDFMLLLEKGAFYLAGERMKAPQFFNSIRGKSEVLQQVQEDNIFVTEEQWERINGKAVVNTETVDSVSDTLTNASLKLNGVSDGMISYNRVVELLLQWYGEKEEF